MSDQPRNRPVDGAQPGQRGDPATPADRLPGGGQAPLRTRRDPVAGTSGRLRPPSRQPSWTGEPSQRQRGTGRYAAPTTDLPPAVIPEGVPGWMGQSDTAHASAGSREPVLPRPLGGPVRRADDYASGWPDRTGTPADRTGSTSTWPSQPTRSGRATIRPSPVPVGEGGDDGPERGLDDGIDLQHGSGGASERRGRGRPTRPERAPRRVGIALFGDPLASGQVLLVAVSAAAMWGLTRYLIGAIDGPVTLRLRADGSAGTAGDPGSIWQVPFVATMLGLMSIGTALLIARRDRFASRFVIGAGILVQALIWVAAITLLRQ